MGAAYPLRRAYEGRYAERSGIDPDHFRKPLSHRSAVSPPEGRGEALDIRLLHADNCVVLVSLPLTAAYGGEMLAAWLHALRSLPYPFRSIMRSSPLIRKLGPQATWIDEFLVTSA